MIKLARNIIVAISSALLVWSALLIGAGAASAGASDNAVRDQTVAEVIALQAQLRALSP